MQGRLSVLVIQSWKDLQPRIPREGARVAVVMVKEDKVGAAGANPRPWAADRTDQPSITTSL